ncbi:hypothetical protein [Endozoicomonas euniceicola]|uniref:Uncharacterized protein n=1 Tax=Endozoicomonas euniceicola TaxID=1234143 RepID=A0ABY6GP48_9GAMM|nr:hypothetical protein [Endozoicomonas euniceicola]UYM14530.1 hypothetical protein NX720_16725 [Endozoicomonas euniceicola]
MTHYLRFTLVDQAALHVYLCIPDPFDQAPIAVTAIFTQQKFTGLIWQIDHQKWA